MPNFESAIVMFSQSFSLIPQLVWLFLISASVLNSLAATRSGMVKTLGVECLL
jgi:hypothetical protein